MILIGHIYYFFGIIVLIKQLFQIAAFKSIDQIKDWQFRYKSVIGRNPKKEDYRSVEEFDLMETNKVLMILELLWVLCGLFSKNWPIFVSFFVLSMVIVIILRPFTFTLFVKIFSVIFTIIKFSLYLLLIINNFYYHLDLWEIFKNQI